MKSRFFAAAAVLKVAIVVVATIFLGSVALAQYTETTLHSFKAGFDGSYGNPAVPDDKGNLWGTSFRGGTNDQGTFYELVPATSGHGWVEKILYSFPVSKNLNGGSFPIAALVHDAAGNYYGLSPFDGNVCAGDGGPGGCGVIWKLSQTSKGWVRTILYSFTGGSDQAGPASLAIDSHGNLFGVTNAYSYGTVFELSPNGANWTFKTIYTFTGGADGNWPNTVILDKAGNLYGTTSFGGNPDGGTCDSEYGSGCGVVFELSPATGGNWTYTNLYSFLNQSDGAEPFGPLLSFGGKLYGIAGGGVNAVGVVFEISRGSGGITESVPYTFSGYTTPSGITVDSTGNLYGSTVEGGSGTGCGLQGCGTMFKLSFSSTGWNYSTLYNFINEYDGFAPEGIAIDNKNDLFVMAEGQSPALMIEFELSPVSGGKWLGSVVHDFPSSRDGLNAQSSLVRDSQGNLYGTTSNGGAYGWGSVFELVPSGSTWQEKVIYNFRNHEDGSSPVAGLAVDLLGNLYGVTVYGGSLNCRQGCGTVFKLSPNSSGGWSYSVIHTFLNGLDGSNPRSGLAVDGGGNVYGTTVGVFKLSPRSQGEWPFTILFTFNGTDGSLPQFESAPVLDHAGNLYGITAQGGTAEAGVIYELSPTSSGPWNETVLYNITFAQQRSEGALAVDHAGNVFGTTITGGANGMGSVFELMPANGNWTFNTIYSFTGQSDGSSPQAGLTLDSSGNLFGVSNTSAYKLSPANGGWQETTIYSSFPRNAYTVNLVIDPSGNLYGTGLAAGSSSPTNIVYELTP